MTPEQKQELEAWRQAVVDSRTTIKFLEKRGDKKSARIRELEDELRKRDEQPMITRPYFSHTHLHDWQDETGELIHGIALRKGREFAAHLTPAEAIELANRLVDLTEKLQEKHHA